MTMRNRAILLVAIVLALAGYAAFGNTVTQLMHTMGVWAPATTFSYTIDTSTPAGSDAPSVIDNRIREAKAGWQERLNVDHYFALTGTQCSSAYTGEHRKITFYETISAPTQVSSKSHLYMTSDELYYQDDTNTTLKLTDAGTINITSADLVGTLANDTYFTAVDAAGTGTVNLIKADTNDEVVLGTIGANVDLNSNKLTNVADATASGDALHLGMYTPTAMASGTQSITFPNGAIRKAGYQASTATSTAITFTAAFPAEIDSIMLTTVASAGIYDQHQVSNGTAATTGFTAILNSATNVVGFYWVAWGY
jgi:hypothetical protein